MDKCKNYKTLEQLTSELMNSPDLEENHKFWVACHKQAVAEGRSDRTDFSLNAILREHWEWLEKIEHTNCLKYCPGDLCAYCENKTKLELWKKKAE